MNILISGNKGFIGSNFEKYLTSQGHVVWGFDIASKDNSLDARDYFKATNTPYDLLIHAAANVGGRKAIDESPLWVAENLEIDRSMFEWAIRTKTPVLYFSSSAVYPVHLQTNDYDGMILQESQVKLEKLLGTPDNTYGWSKLTGEFLAGIARDKGARITIVRPFSGYGSDQSPDYPFGSFIQKAMSDDNVFEVWGSGYTTRDWIHIDDIMRACMVLVEHNISWPVNLCTGRSTSFDTLANMFMLAAGKHKYIQHNLKAPVGCYHRVGNPTTLKQFYAPSVSLEEGIIRAIADNS